MVPDADSFSFDTASGQIRTKSPLNHEDPGVRLRQHGSYAHVHL